MSSLTASDSALAMGEFFAVTNPTGVELICPRNLVPAMCVASFFRLSVGPKYRSTLPLARPRKIGAESLKYCTVHGCFPDAAHLDALEVSRVWKVEPGAVAMVYPQAPVIVEMELALTVEAPR